MVVSDFSFGYTTRDSGERARTLSINMVTQTKEKQLIILDFKDISIISSSFADEFIAKLIYHFGFLKFNSIFRTFLFLNYNCSVSESKFPLYRLKYLYSNLAGVWFIRTECGRLFL